MMSIFISHVNSLLVQRGPKCLSFRMHSSLLNADQGGIKEAALQLKRGGLVAFPTETVYGLGGDALNAASCRRIFHVKRRPASDPLIVHVSDFEETHSLFAYQSDAPQGRAVVKALCAAFWPGPLTVIHAASARVPPEVTANTGYVGVRSPQHPIARTLLRVVGVPLAAPSANRFGHVSPTSYEHVIADLGDENLFILRDDPKESGGCLLGIESTVCRVGQTGERVDVLRAGFVTPSMIGDVLVQAGIRDVHVVLSTALSGMEPEEEEGQGERGKEGGAGGAVAPGQMLKHYAPDIPTSILSHSLVSSGGATSSATLARLVKGAVVIDFGGKLHDCAAVACAGTYIDLSPTGNAEEACHRVFAVLRQAEETGGTRLLLPDLRREKEGSELVLALWERLHRAASGRFEM